MALQTEDIQRLFRRVDSWPPTHLAPQMALSTLLRTSLANRTTVILGDDQAALFLTAAVEMWQRAVHSLIVAMSLKQSSEIWACVAGYYASHYAIRAYGHLFGYFALYYPRKLLVEISQYGGRFQCATMQQPNIVRREHSFYWTIVRRSLQIASDRLFTDNDDSVPLSDAAHRGVASYADHLNQFKPYEPLEKKRLRAELINLARTALDGEASIMIPDRDQYPQMSLVLSLAYLRIYRFREYLDAALTGGGRFWRRHRVPSWCTDVFVFPARPAAGLPS